VAPSRISFLLLGTFTVAVLVLQWWQHAVYPPLLWGILFAVMGLSALAMLLRRKFLMTVFVIVSGITLGLAAVARTTHVPSPNTADWYATGENVTLTGVIRDEPDRRPMQTKYTVAVESLRQDNGTVQRTLRGRVLVTDRSRRMQFQYGDRVEVFGTLKKPERFEDFAYDKYLSRHHIESILDGRSLRPAADRCDMLPATMRLRRGLFALKETIEDRINMLLPEPHASFLAGLLTGSRRGIPETLTADFATTGLTHIIAISGYNITIVTAIIMSVLFWLPIRFRLLPAVCAIAVFTVFVGASAAVVRAAIMGTLGLFAIHCGRTRDIRLALLWTLAIMVAWNPKYLWYDAGFQLSFLSVLGLLELSPFLKKPMERIPDMLGMRESLQATIAAQIATLPLTMILFHRVSLIAPVANVLAAPMIPPAMLLGSIAVLVSTITQTGGRLVAAGVWCCLQWIITVTHLLANIPLAAIP